MVENIGHCHISVLVCASITVDYDLRTSLSTFTLMLKITGYFTSLEAKSQTVLVMAEPHLIVKSAGL